MRRQNRLDEEAAKERLLSLTHQLNFESERGALIVVEGARDEMALRRLGFEGEVYKLCYTRRSMSGLMAKAEVHSKVILLLDYDLKGRALMKKVSSMLQDKGLNVDTTFRREIRAATGGLASHLEDLKRFASKEGVV